MNKDGRIITCGSISGLTLNLTLALTHALILILALPLTLILTLILTHHLFFTVNPNPDSQIEYYA